MLQVMKEELARRYVDLQNYRSRRRSVKRWQKSMAYPRPCKIIYESEGKRLEIAKNLEILREYCKGL